MAKITIFGLAGTGKSTASKFLAERLIYKLVSSGVIFRQKAAELNLDLYTFDVLCNSNPEYDKELDSEIQKYGETHDDFVIESRLAWYFVPDSYKVKLTCDLDTRIKRVAGRDKVSFKEAKEKTLRREKDGRERYRQIYGIKNFGADKHFDLIIDTTTISPEKVVDMIIKSSGVTIKGA